MRAPGPLGPEPPSQKAPPLRGAPSHSACLCSPASPQGLEYLGLVKINAFKTPFPLVSRIFSWDQNLLISFPMCKIEIPFLFLNLLFLPICNI